ncbi:MAG TPA: DNA polymerase/3'-5' exonuclease PolX [Anaerolineales bacterium]|nr:DNA polymerase/3'-5' exonuclease PolX [Anaerolineales bacterium]
MNKSAAKMTTSQIIEVFTRIADLMEIKGEVIYKILAYRKAVDSLENLAGDVVSAWQAGTLTEIPGVGKAIAEKIDEMLSTGKLEFLERLEQEVPPGLIEVLKVPDVGPKKTSLFWKQAGITNMTELEAAAKSGKLRSLPGMGEKSETKILAGIEAVARRTDRIPLGKAWLFAQELIKILSQVPGVEKVALAGSLRRMRATVGDLDLLAASSNSGPVMQAFVEHPNVIRILSQGEVKSSVEYSHNLRAQLWVHPPERFGTALQYATGSKEHNVRLREIAQKQGLSLSDQSFQKSDGTEILCATEEEVYQTLGLPWIAPELREDHGEVQAAKENKLPDLITVQDIQSELHTHSTWSDGKLSIRQMAEAAIQRGLKVLAVTDHSGSLGVAGGLSVEDLIKQREEIDQVQAELGSSIRLLQGCEVEIRADGSLDFPDDVLVKLDIVIASLHSSLRQPGEKITQRLINVIQNPHVDIIGHPTGRMIPNREGADLDMESIFKSALDHDVVLEINAHPSRLDLNDVHARRFMDMGGILSINTDAHSASDLDMLIFGVATARRAWLEPRHVINTWKSERLLDWLSKRGS